MKRVILILLAIVFAWHFGPSLTKALAFLPIEEFAVWLIPDDLDSKDGPFWVKLVLWILTFIFLLPKLWSLMGFAVPNAQRYSTTKVSRRIQGIFAECFIVAFMFLIASTTYMWTDHNKDRLKTPLISFLKESFEQRRKSVSENLEAERKKLDWIKLKDTSSISSTDTLFKWPPTSKELLQGKSLFSNPRGGWPKARQPIFNWLTTTADIADLKELDDLAEAGRISGYTLSKTPSELLNDPLALFGQEKNLEILKRGWRRLTGVLVYESAYKSL